MDRHSLSLFSDACSADGSLHLEAEGPMGVVRRVVCPQPFALIGRHPRADLVLPHAGVNQRHVYLQVIGGRIFFVDLGSPLGIHSGGGFVRSGWLEPGRDIYIGPYRVKVSGGGPRGPG